MGSEYEPWGHLLSLGQGVTLSVESTPGDKPAWWCPVSDHIMLRPDLNRIERRSHLAHELAHRDLGHGVHPHDADAERTIAREERHADELAARRLVTLDALITALCWSDEASEIAEALGVTPHLLDVRVESMYHGERKVVSVALKAALGDI
jgi:hypothetical protein